MNKDQHIYFIAFSISFIINLLLMCLQGRQVQEEYAVGAVITKQLTSGRRSSGYTNQQKQSPKQKSSNIPAMVMYGR